MSGHDLGSLPSIHDQKLPPEAAAAAPPRRRATDRVAGDFGALMRFEEEQLAREFADIEHASAALRLGEPSLRPTPKPAVPMRKARPLWFLIGVLWLSTAIVTVGAMAAIATLAG